MDNYGHDCRAAELSHAQLAAIVESSDDAILSKDLEGTIETWNRSAERLYGYTAEEAIGRSVSMLMAPEKPDEFRTIMDELKRGNRIDHHDTVRIHKDGRRIEVSVSISPIRAPDGRLVGAASIAREIGERKRLEQARWDAADRVARLHRVTAALSEALAPGHVAEVVVHQGVEALGAWAGLVGLVQGEAFEILASTGYRSALMGQWHRLDLSGPYPVADAIRTCQPVWIESHEEYLRRYPAIAGVVAAKTESAVAMPLLTHGRAIGALFLSFDSRQRFDHEEQGFMQALSYQCAQALERSRLYDAERRAREDAEDARRRSAFLAEASAILSSSLDDEATLAGVARLVAPEWADWCAIHVSSNGNAVKPVVVAHADPGKVAWAEELQERYPAVLRADQGLGLVMRTGEAVIYNDITDEMVVEAARDDRHLSALREIGLGSVLMAPMVARGRPIGVITFIRGREGQAYTAADKELAEDLARRCALSVDNARLFRESQELNRAKDEFQAMLAHELRNPIGALSNALYLMDVGGAHSESALKYRGIAGRQLRHITRLLDDLLDVSRITRGKVRLRLKAVSLGAVVEDAVLALQPVFDNRRQHLSVNLPEEPLWVSGDPDRLEQVIRNLLDNAAKYTQDGGRIEVSVEQRSDTAFLRVKDDGAGVSRDLLPRIFELFTQADHSLDRAEGGLGIGLTVVKSLVEMHGGTVQAFSEGPGQGSEFCVSLPLLQMGGALGEGEPATGPEAARVSPGRNVLLVEDNADAAETLSDLLTIWGHTVRCAPDGPTALQLFHEQRPDVVLLDIGLPGMDGLEVGRRLRMLDNREEVLLVALSGYGQPEDRVRSQAAGFSEHLTKPVEPSALQQILSHAPKYGGAA